VPFELEDIPEVRAAEGVDRLVVIPDHAEVAAGPGQVARQVELYRVRVLVLVDHEVVPASPEIAADLFVLLQEPDREEEQVVEVDGAGRAQRLLVAGVRMRGEDRV